MEDALELLRRRGFVQDVTDEDGLRRLLRSERVTFYVGFDPTAPSLHVGNLVGIMAMAHLQRLGHRPIAVVGGATGRIGDPSGRDSERELLSEEELDRNRRTVAEQLARFLDLTDPDRGLLVDNYDWLKEWRYLDFLREVGKHFSVNAMIAREAVRRRLEERDQGISYTEFSYQLLQAYDFAHLYATYGCRLQGGGSDQWGNITAGIELIRRMYGGEAYGLVWPLLLTAEGAKFGKSAGNAVWLDAALTSPYAYYQFWINTHDDDVVRFLRLFTFLDEQTIAELEVEHRRDPAARVAHRRLAEEATRIAHGEEGLRRAQRATAVLFGDGAFRDLDDRTLADAFGQAPSVELPRARLNDGLTLPEVMVAVGAARSRSDARRLISQGGVRLNNVPVSDPDHLLRPEDLASESTAVVTVGRKRHYLVRFR